MGRRDWKWSFSVDVSEASDSFFQMRYGIEARHPLGTAMAGADRLESNLKFRGGGDARRRPDYHLAIVMWWQSEGSGTTSCFQC